MNWFNNLKISTKIGIGYGIAVIFFIATVAFSILYLNQVSAMGDRVANLRSPTVSSSIMMMNGINHSLSGLRGWMLLGVDKYKLERLEAWQDEIIPSLETLRELSSSWTNQKNISLLKQITRDIRLYEQHQNEIEDLAHTLDNRLAHKILIEEAAPRGKILLEKITEVINFEKQQSSTEKRKKLLAIFADIRGATARGLASIRAFLLTKDSKYKLEFEASWDKSTLRIAQLEEYMPLLTPEQVSAINVFLETRSHFEPLPGKMFDLHTRKDSNIANYLLQTKLSPVSDRILDTLALMVGDQKEQLAVDAEQSVDNISFLKAINLLLLLLGLFVVLFVAFFISRRITSPITKLVGFSDQLAQGIYTNKPLDLNRKDEIGLLASAIDSVNDLLSTRKHESDATIKGVVDTANDAFITIDEGGIIESVNAAGLKIFGYTESEIVGENVKMLMPNQFSREHDSYLINYLTTSNKKVIGKGREVIALHKDGREFPAYLHVGEIKLANGTSKFSGIVRDITEQKTYEAEIQRQNDELDLQAKNKSNVAALYEVMSGDQDISEFGANILRFVAEIFNIQIGLLYFVDHTEPDLKEKSENSSVIKDAITLNCIGEYGCQKPTNKRGDQQENSVIYQSIENKKTTILTDVPSNYFKISSGLGGVPPSNIMVIPIFFQREVVAVLELATLRQLDEESILEIEKFCENIGVGFNANRAKAKLNDALASLEKRSEDLSRASQYKSEFLANMSHEIRTPMAGVIGMADLVLNTELSQEQLKWVSSIKQSGNHLLKILNEILDQSKLEAGKVEIDNVDFNFYAYIDSIVSSFQPKAVEKGISIDLLFEENVTESIHADSLRIGQVLTNLLSNALKFTEEGKIIVRVSQHIGKDGQLDISISVEDNGIGMTPSQQGKLFSAFQQADSSTSRNYGGTGLGLSISKQLVELMGGKIGVDSEYEKGSRFWFNFISQPAQKSIPRTELKTELEIWKANRRLKILLAEDTLVLQEIMQSVFKPLQHELTITENGKEALEKVKQNHFDLVLMDIRMPVMDGRSATKAIRLLSGEKSKIPIIALTADVASNNLNEFNNDGFSAVCTKPLNLPELLLTINKIFNEKIHVIDQGVGSSDSQLIETPGEDKPNAILFSDKISKIGEKITSLPPEERNRFYQDTQLPGISEIQMQSLIHSYESRLVEQCRDLEHFIDGYDESKGKNREAISELVHKLKGGGSTCGYTLVTYFSELLEDIFNASTQLSTHDFQVVKQYSQILSLIARTKLGGDGGKIGDELKSLVIVH